MAVSTATRKGQVVIPGELRHKYRITRSRLGQKSASPMTPKRASSAARAEHRSLKPVRHAGANTRAEQSFAAVAVHRW